MSYIGQGLPDNQFIGYDTETFTGDGTANKAFTLSKKPFSENSLLVTIDGVVQEATEDFTVSGTTLTLVGTAPNNSEVNVVHLGAAAAIGEASKLDLNGASDQLILDADADTTISADTDDQIDFKAGGTDIMSLTATTATFNDGVTISVADNSDTLTLVSTDTDSSIGPNLNIYRNAGNGADADNVGTVAFAGNDDAGNATDYARITAQIDDASNGSEDVFFEIRSMTAGTERKRISIHGAETVFNDDSQDIDFRVETDSQTHGLFVDAGNNMVAVNNSTYDNAQFKVQQDTASRLMARFEHHASSGNVYGLRFEFKAQAPDNHTSDFLVAGDTTASRLFILADGDIQNHDNSYGAISDERIKQDIRDSNSQWDDIKAVKVRNYKKKDDVRQYGDKAWEQIGVIAQELEDAGMDKLIKESDPTFGDILSDSSFGTLYEDGDTIPEGKKIGDVKEVKQKVKGVSYSVLYMKAIKALQEAMAKIETLETKVKALEDA